MKILGIDDNADITEMLDTVLNSAGHEFSFVNKGREGLEKIKQEIFDVVLLDLSMPNFTGVDVVNALNEEGIINKQKIVLFTASSMTETEIEKLIDEGVHSCIRKPVDIPDLLEKLSELENS
ncbi:MAG: response regulator [Nitrosopumilaceae archaeon]